MPPVKSPAIAPPQKPIARYIRTTNGNMSKGSFGLSLLTFSMNRDRLIADAKKEVLALAASGYVQPQQRTDILALGNPALATLKLGVHMMKRAGYISDHDALIGEKLARILTGGDLNHATKVSEQYLLDLEREAFLSLIGTRKTQDRIAHMLKTGKPLRN